MANPYYGTFAGQQLGHGHSSNTFIDQYGNTQHAENAAQQNAFNQFQQTRRVRQDLGLYNQYANKHLADLQRLFGQQTQYGIGQATGNVMANINQFLTRRGIDPRRSGIAASLQAQQLGGLQQQGTQAQLNFSQQLLQHMQQDQNAIVTGDLTFFQTLDRMNVNNELNKDLMRFQQGLQRDSQRWQALGSVLGLGGQVLGGLFGGGGLTGGQLAYDASSGPTPNEFNQMQPVYG